MGDEKLLPQIPDRVFDDGVVAHKAVKNALPAKDEVVKPHSDATTN